MAGLGGSSGVLRRLTLRDRHAALGARFAPFAGWEMPLQYEGIVGEHEAVRDGVGVFDVSHLARAWVRGPQAAAQLRSVTTFDVTTAARGGQGALLAVLQRGRRHRRRRVRLPPARRPLADRSTTPPTPSADLRAPAGSSPTTPPPTSRRRDGRCSPCRGRRRSTLLSGVLGEGLAALAPRDCVEFDWGGDAHALRPDRLHRRGRRRVHRRRRSARGQLWDTLLAGGAVPAGLGRTRHAAARGGAATPRQRHRRHHAPLRGRTGIRREPRRWGGLHRPGGTGVESKARPRTRRLCPPGWPAGEACRERVYDGDTRPAPTRWLRGSPAAGSARSLGLGIGMAYLPSANLRSPASHC